MLYNDIHNNNSSETKKEFEIPVLWMLGGVISEINVINVTEIFCTRHKFLKSWLQSFVALSECIRLDPIKLCLSRNKLSRRSGDRVLPDLF